VGTEYQTRNCSCKYFCSVAGVFCLLSVNFIINFNNLHLLSESLVFTPTYCYKIFLCKIKFVAKLSHWKCHSDLNNQPTTVWYVFSQLGVTGWHFWPEYVTNLLLWVLSSYFVVTDAHDSKKGYSKVSVPTGNEWPSVFLFFYPLHYLAVTTIVTFVSCHELVTL